MAVLSALVFIGLAAGYSEAAWCVCRPGADPNALQSAIDYACGHGADCGPISANGPCYQPNTRLAHCSYAVNSYFQRASQAPAACDFSGTATTTTVDPRARVRRRALPRYRPGSDPPLPGTIRFRTGTEARRHGRLGSRLPPRPPPPLV
ncbi:PLASMODESMATA CALLOSE-BINDING PROTEIN 2-like isoform X2 [Wolffia australiana]